MVTSSFTSVVTLTDDTLSGTFKFDVSPAGNTVQTGSGTTTATRFVIRRSEFLH